MPDVPVTLEEQLACVEREIGMRLRVYPRWVAAKKMSQATADKEIERMRAVLETLRGVGPRAAALRRVVDASDQFVRDTGLKHGDLLTDAVDAARPLVGRGSATHAGPK